MADVYEYKKIVKEGDKISASDVMATNRLTVQQNLERIDRRIDNLTTLVIRSTSYQTLTDSGSTEVPVLSLAQHEDIVTALVSDRRMVYVVDLLGRSVSLVRGFAMVDGNYVLYMTYLDRLELAYTKTNGTVTISFTDLKAR